MLYKKPDSVSGSVRERDFTFFWQGKSLDKTREYGVSFAVKNSLLRSIIPPTEETESCPYSFTLQLDQSL